MSIASILTFFNDTSETIIDTLSAIWTMLSTWTLADWFRLLGDNVVVNSIIDIINNISLAGVVIGQITMFDLMFSFLSVVIVISFIKWIVNLIP